MELELKKEQFACYQALPQLSENREETTETIVPDYLPDIARIVDASGCLFLRSREIADGKAQVSGTVRMTLLYVAEDAQGMKSFEYTLPLDETIEGRALSGSADSCLDGRLCSCEVRMLNPRKVVHARKRGADAYALRARVAERVQRREGAGSLQDRNAVREKGHRYYPRHSGKGLHFFR